MGGTILKENIVIENEDFQIIGGIDAWETCLWRIKVNGKIIKKNPYNSIDFVYETIDHKVTHPKFALNSDYQYNEREQGILRTIGDLIIIRAIREDYAPEAIENLESELDISLNDFFLEGK